MPLLEEARLHAAGELPLGEAGERLGGHRRDHLVREPPGLAQRGDLVGLLALAQRRHDAWVEVNLQLRRARPA